MEEAGSSRAGEYWRFGLRMSLRRISMELRALQEYYARSMTAYTVLTMLPEICSWTKGSGISSTQGQARTATFDSINDRTFVLIRSPFMVQSALASILPIDSLCFGSDCKPMLAIV